MHTVVQWISQSESLNVALTDCGILVWLVHGWYFTLSHEIHMTLYMYICSVGTEHLLCLFPGTAVMPWYMTPFEVFQRLESINIIIGVPKVSLSTLGLDYMTTATHNHTHTQTHPHTNTPTLHILTLHDNCSESRQGFWHRAVYSKTSPTHHLQQTWWAKNIFIKKANKNCAPRTRMSSQWHSLDH